MLRAILRNRKTGIDSCRVRSYDADTATRNHRLEIRSELRFGVVETNRLTSYGDAPHPYDLLINVD
jgi:hypothetical protein